MSKQVRLQKDEILAIKTAIIIASRDENYIDMCKALDNLLKRSKDEKNKTNTK